MNTTTNYIGFSTLEGLAEVLDSTRPVYANVIQENTHNDKHGIRYYEHVVVVAQPGGLNGSAVQNGGIMNYWRMQVAMTQYIANTPLSSDHEQRLAAAKSAWECVRGWLKSRYTVHEAIPAFPKALKLLNGDTTLLHYDKEQHTFSLKGE